MLSDSEIREQLGPFAGPPPEPEPIRRPAGLIAVLVVLVLCLFGGSIALLVHYVRVSPRIPDPRSGHVYRFTDTRHTVYLTRKQHYTAYAALGVPLLGVVAIALFSRPRRPTITEH